MDNFASIFSDTPTKVVTYRGCTATGARPTAYLAMCPLGSDRFHLLFHGGDLFLIVVPRPERFLHLEEKEIAKSEEDGFAFATEYRTLLKDSFRSGYNKLRCYLFAGFSI